MWVYPMKVIFGNHCQTIESPAPHYKDESLLMRYRWLTFLSINNDKALTQEHIRGVTYYLHPSYQMRQVTITDPPFILSRTAYAPSVIGIKITFQKETIDPVFIDHIIAEKGVCHEFYMKDMG